MTDFSFQVDVAQDVLEAALTDGQAVCAIACGGGKSTIAQVILNKYFAKRSGTAVVITENNNALKSQFLDDLKNSHIPIQFRFGEFGDESQVQVGVAASLQKVIGIPSIVLIDEAHRYSSASMISMYLKRTKPDAVIYFTGTPARFIKENQTRAKKTKIIFISGAELQKKGLYSGVTMDVVRISRPNDPKTAVESLLSHASRMGDDLTKTLIACPSIKYANNVAAHLNSLGKKVFLSTSRNDPDGETLSESRASKECFIVTVNRCSLGYSDPNITALVDFRSSTSSLSNGFQLFARVLRRSDCGIDKKYYRISSRDPKSYNKQVLFLHKLSAYLSREIFEDFSGSNLNIEISCGQNQIKLGSVG